ncbi:hypothetical protein M378DRAFT_172072 [Amanita muscaria Koide BX008]|uniref:Uncharacterized protein n=1 Tax=Amanita muscaria (strain Koide BX008) TaxID=946122 RepID=A0A0C2W7N5_AMAMK|nr:hypothetical protein M378DRAFT_172072 [Amanita muscaria Koide BX008]
MLRDSAQSPEPEKPLTKSATRRPRLYNPDIRLGPIIRLSVFGFPMSSKALVRWANNNQIAPNKTENNRCFLTWQAICRRLPEDCRRWALVTTEEGTLAHCVVIATNDTRKDRKRAKDAETIKAVQDVMDVHTAPKWYVMET